MDSYAHYLVFVFMVIGVAWLYWLIRRETRPLRARLSNHCTRCGYDLSGTPDRCPECGMEIDYDDHIAGELDADLLERDWPSTKVEQRTPEFSEQAIAIHTTVKMSEATLLQEQLAARGYACRLDSSSPAQTYPGLGPQMPAFSVMVYTEDLAAARQYVRGLRRAARLKHSPTR